MSLFVISPAQNRCNLIFCLKGHDSKGIRVTLLTGVNKNVAPLLVLHPPLHVILHGV